MTFVLYCINNTFACGWIMTTLPTQNLALGRIRTGGDLVAAEVRKARPAARKKNQKYRHKNKKDNKDDDSAHRKLHAFSFPDVAL